jgi:NitT/TauT family transport system permease protein
VSLVACVVLWHVISSHRLSFRLVDFGNVPTPAEVVGAGRALAASPKVAAHVLKSLERVLGGFALAALIGSALGLAIGRSRRAADLLLPPLEVLRPIPGVAWIPLAILMFPSSEASMVFITFMGAVFPVILSTVHGVEALEPRLEASARCLGARGRHVFWELVVPGALPQVFTGLAIGMGTAWFCLVTAEMIAGQYGIGYFTWEAYNLQRYPDIVLGMLAIGALGLGSSALVRWLGRALTPWYHLRTTPQASGPRLTLASSPLFGGVSARAASTRQT